MILRARASMGLGAIAIGLGGIAVVASPAVATQAASPTAVSGIVQAVNAWTAQTQGYAYTEYSVGNIAESSVNPSYARAQIIPLAAYRSQIPMQWTILYGADSQWTVVDGGTNFCDNVGTVPSAVVNDLFPSGQQCGPTSNKYTMAKQSNGGYTLTLQAQRGTGSKSKWATVYLQQSSASGIKVTERRLGPVNGYWWSVVTATGNSYLTLNAQNQWALAQVYQSPSTLYSVFPFKVTAFGLTPSKKS